MRAAFVEFGGVRFVAAPGWLDITDQSGDGPPTLARNDGQGVMQFSSAGFRGGELPNIGEADLLRMLDEFGRNHGFTNPVDVSIKCAPLLIVGGSFYPSDERIRAWYVSDRRSLCFITYLSAGPDINVTENELFDVENMVSSIVAIDV